jgi:hypothetical protein
VVYNEGVLRGLDYVLNEARQRGIRVLLVSPAGRPQTCPCPLMLPPLNIDPGAVPLILLLWQVLTDYFADGAGGPKQYLQ